MALTMPEGTKKVSSQIKPIVSSVQVQIVPESMIVLKKIAHFCNSFIVSRSELATFSLSFGS